MPRELGQDRHLRAKAIFLTARKRPRETREAFIVEACGDDPKIRREVESLLHFLDKADERWEPQSSTSTSLQPSPLPEKIGNYRIVRKLGEGGMGEVYEAEQTGALRRTVALKLIKWGMDSQQVIARFEAERQALALMNHPAIAHVFEAGATDQGRLYFAMENVPGPPITEYCDSHRLNIRERLALFLQVCSGVQHAHSKGVIHRDLKPSNVLVKSEDGKPVPKLIDFGVARATAQRLTERTLYTDLGQWVGTPDYMSPEQAGLGEDDVDARSDVYSLGVVLYELLVGAPPIDSDALREAGFDEMRRRIREDDPPTPSARLRGLGDGSLTATRNRNTDTPALVNQLRRDLDWVVMKALEKDRDRRYSTVAEFGADIERHLEHKPVEARPPSATYRLRKFARRSQAAFTAGVLALVTLSIGIATTSLWLGRSEPNAVAPSAGVSTTNQEASVAVLPFVNLSSDPENEYFSDGLSEELLNALARVDGLRVAARTSSFAYKDKNEDIRTIAEALAVNTVLEGSVRRSGTGLRVVAQLIEAKSGLHLWSRTFDREIGDVFAIQAEIARAVADALKVELLESSGSTASPASTIEVYDRYLRGRQQLRIGSPEAISAGLRLFEQAVLLDPAYAPAHSGLAEGYILLARRGDLPMETADRQAGAALKRALELDGRLAEAHAALGMLRSTMGDLNGAESALRRALELNDNLAEAHLRLGGVLAAGNHGAEADAAYQRALALDPLSPGTHHAIARSLMNRGNYEEGMSQFQRFLRIEPDSAETFRRMSLYARTYGKLDDAVAWALRAVELGPEAPLNLHELVMAYSGLGEFDEAAEWMDRAYRLAPNNHWTVTLKAFVFIERGDLDGLEEFTQLLLRAGPSLDVSPLPPAARVRLALAALSKIYQRDYASAVEFYERALGQPFTGILEIGIDADALSFLAYAYRKLDRHEDAAAASTRCLELVRSRQDWIWSHLIMPETIARIYALEGRDEEAVEILRNALADGWLSRSVLRRTPHFDDLRQRDDYQQLIEQAERRLERMRRRMAPS